MTSEEKASLRRYRVTGISRKTKTYLRNISSPERIKKMFRLTLAVVAVILMAYCAIKVCEGMLLSDSCTGRIVSLGKSWTSDGRKHVRATVIYPVSSPSNSTSMELVWDLGISAPSIGSEVSVYILPGGRAVPSVEEGNTFLYQAGMVFGILLLLASMIRITDSGKDRRMPAGNIRKQDSAAVQKKS